MYGQNINNIESKIRNRNKQATGLLGISKYSLEHLMPKKWENNFLLNKIHKVLPYFLEKFTIDNTGILINP